jgi:hypothetical protein
MKNVCDQAKFPAKTSPIETPRAVSPIYPSPMATPWVRYATVVGCALKGQHTAATDPGATLFPNLYIALSGRHERTAPPKTQGKAIGLGYARLSALPPTVRVYQGGHLILSHTFFIATPRTESPKYPSPMASPWVRYATIVGCALKGQHTAATYPGATLFPLFPFIINPEKSIREIRFMGMGESSVLLRLFS